MIGKKVIVRSNKAGVFYGTLEAKNGDELTMSNTRCLWYWSGAASLNQLAAEGVKAPDKCKFSMYVKEIMILGAIEIIPCTEEAICSIEGVKEWKV